MKFELSQQNSELIELNLKNEMLETDKKRLMRAIQQSKEGQTSKVNNQV